MTLYRRLATSVLLLSFTLSVAAPEARAVEPADFRFENTRALYTLCRASEDDPLFGEARQACFAFMYGVGLFYKEAIKAGRARSIVCPEGELTREAVREAFLAWADQHPEAMDTSPIEGLLRAAAARWPCPEPSDARPERNDSR